MFIVIQSSNLKKKHNYIKRSIYLYHAPQQIFKLQKPRIVLNQQSYL